MLRNIAPVVRDGVPSSILGVLLKRNGYRGITICFHYKNSCKAIWILSPWYLEIYGFKQRHNNKNKCIIQTYILILNFPGRLILQQNTVNSSWKVKPLLFHKKVLHSCNIPFKMLATSDLVFYVFVILFRKSDS
jgi:hypothetical protein